jgi:hypothetical protein
VIRVTYRCSGNLFCLLFQVRLSQPQKVEDVQLLGGGDSTAVTMVILPHLEARVVLSYFVPDHVMYTSRPPGRVAGIRSKRTIHGFKKWRGAISARQMADLAFLTKNHQHDFYCYN